MMNIIKSIKKDSEKKHVKNIKKILKSFWRRNRRKAKKGPRKISKYFRGTKAQATWAYEKLLFTT